ncbi:MAG: hypothetical protein E6I97_24805, partial [Chloroflexi bacterium]
MPHRITKHRWSVLFVVGLAMMAVVVVACAGGSTTTSSGSIAEPMNAPSNANQQKSVAPHSPQQYLIKALNITMEAKDTQRAASDLQAWISTTDPLSTAENINYQQV